MHIAILDSRALSQGDLTWDSLKQFGTVSVYPRTAPTDTYELAKDADIVITNKVRFDSTLLERLPKLKCIVVTATGYNVIDTEAAGKRGIVVCNAPAYSTNSVAQHVFALLLHITTHVADYSALNRAGRWAASPDFCYIAEPTVELAGKTMGIIGLGNIGLAVAAIGHAMGLRILALTSKHADFLPDYVVKADLDTMLQTADIISLHCPLIPDTEHIINERALARAKDGLILINTARGPLVDEQAVANALHSGKLAAFGADVLGVEPPQADNPLLSAPNAFTTPHIAWATVEARQRLMQITIDNVRAFVSGSPINVVNTPKL